MSMDFTGLRCFNKINRTREVRALKHILFLKVSVSFFIVISVIAFVFGFLSFSNKGWIFWIFAAVTLAVGLVMRRYLRFEQQYLEREN